MNSHLQEGALTFTFEAGAQARKYDTWSFYRKQFQQGCFTDNKAVDLLCEFNRSAWLIEVKDYRLPPRTKVVDLADELAIKVRDTLAGLVAASIGANDPDERTFARRMLRAQRIRVVFHIEQPAKASRGTKPALAKTDAISFRLDDKKQSVFADALVTLDVDAEGIPVAIAGLPSGDSPAMVAAMRSASSVSVWRENPRTRKAAAVHKFSLAGFTANFLKLAEWCGFDANRLKTP